MRAAQRESVHLRGRTEGKPSELLLTDVSRGRLFTRTSSEGCCTSVQDILNELDKKNDSFLIFIYLLTIAVAQNVQSSTLAASHPADNNLTAVYYITSIVGLLIISGCVAFC